MKTLLFILFFLFILQIFIPPKAIGQQNGRISRDSIDYSLKNIEYSDTTVQQLPDAYKNIKKKATNKWMNRLYDVLVREPSANVPASAIESIDADYVPYEGKIIRKIEITVLKPFGTSINEPDSVNSSKWFNRKGNALHNSTKKFIVRNNLQFREGQAVDPIIMAETEAFLRGTSYINDARIYVAPVPDSDMVDVRVVVRDVWSIGLTVHKLDPSSANIEFFDKNFMGIGNRYDVSVIYDKDYPKHWGFGIGYGYDNLFRSFTNVSASYLDNISYKNLSLNVERALQTSLDYFGKVSYDEINYRPSCVSWDSITPDHNSNLSLALGKAFTLPDKHFTKRFVISAAYYHRDPNYQFYHLSEDDEIPYAYTKNKTYLAQFSFYKQAYYRQHLINNFGTTENIAHGFNISTQIGYSDFEDYRDGFYASLATSGGKQYKSGNYYLYGSISSFFNDDEAYGGVLKTGLQYFSPLMRLKKSRFRHFVNVDYTKLLNPISIFENVLYYSNKSTLNTHFYDYHTKGVERLMFNLETDFFSPINLIGFRFVFYTFSDLGWITSASDLLSKKNFYGGIGFGIRIRNDLLVFRTLDIRFGWYPKFPQETFNQYFDLKMTEPNVSPSFVPSYPKEIPLD